MDQPGRVVLGQRRRSPPRCEREQGRRNHSQRDVHEPSSHLRSGGPRAACCNSQPWWAARTEYQRQRREPYSLPHLPWRAAQAGHVAMPRAMQALAGRPIDPPGGRGDAVETSLYPPVKRYLEKLGFAVKGEIRGCDVVGLRADGLVVICELKLSLQSRTRAPGRRPQCGVRGDLAGGASTTCGARAGIAIRGSASFAGCSASACSASPLAGTSSCSSNPAPGGRAAI